MYIYELFNTQPDKQVKAKWKHDKSVGMETSDMYFTASNGVKYKLEIIHPDMAPDEILPDELLDFQMSDDYYDLGRYVSFEQVGKGDYDGKMGIAGTGAAAEVFGIVVNAITQFIKKHKPTYLYFQAAEPSRIKLYARMVSRMVTAMPEYKSHHDGNGHFIIYRPIKNKQGVAEGKTVTRIDSKPITDFASSLKAYKHTDDWSQSGLDTGDDSYWKNKNLKTNTTKGLFAGDPRRTALYATGNAHETRYVEFTLDGQPIVYFDKKDLPAMRSRKTYLTVFDADNFKQLPTGEWFSQNPGKPIKQMPIGDPFKYIADQGWIVRVTDDLDKVFNQVKKMHKAGKIAQYGAEGMNESKQGVAEDSVDEMAAAGNFSNRIWYHGTTKKNYEKILKDRVVKPSLADNESVGAAIWLTSSPLEALDYGPVLLAIDNQTAKQYKFERFSGYPHGFVKKQGIKRDPSEGYHMVIKEPVPLKYFRKVDKSEIYMQDVKEGVAEDQISSEEIDQFEMGDSVIIDTPDDLDWHQREGTILSISNDTCVVKLDSGQKLSVTTDQLKKADGIQDKRTLSGFVVEALKLDAPSKVIPRDELQGYATRIKTGSKTKQDKFGPIVHASNIKAIAKSDDVNENGDPVDIWDLDDLAKQITTRPKAILGTNAKMEKSKDEGEIIYDLTLPALKGLVVDEETNDFVQITTCPGAGECQLFCYARKGGYIMFPASSMSAAQALNFLVNDPVGYSKMLNNEISAIKQKTDSKGITLVVRWHDAGDFFSKDYLDLAYAVANANPDVKFYAYTKIADVATGNKPDNFIINFSSGAKRGETKKIELHKQQGNVVKQGITVPKDMFFDLIARTGNKLIKDAKGRTQFKDNDSLEEFKRRLAKEYNVPFNSILTYDEMLSTPVGDTPQWNVIVQPGAGDRAANRKDVIDSYLMFH